MAESVELPDHDARIAALDTSDSIIVQAPAGSGKTTLLAQRYLRLLTLVDKPQEILAITFTKKAAQEMRSRVLDLIAETSEVAAAVRDCDRQRGWDLQANPNQLKIQTIDSFAYEVTSQSTGLNNARGLTLIEDADPFYEEAAERLLAKLYINDPFSEFIADFLEFIDNNATQAVRLVSQMLAKRDQWLDAATSLMSHAQDANHMAALLREAIASLRATVCEPIERELITGDMEQARALTSATGTSASLTEIAPLLLTNAGKLRKRFSARDHVAFSNQSLRRDVSRWVESIRERGLAGSFATLARLPDTELHPAQTSVLTTCCTCLALAAVELDKIFLEREVLDFTGLLLRAQRGLREEDAPTELALQWDYRINHILVDEFQDTSRSQYRLFTYLTEGWQAGDGRTFFAVGDPMQSIYRFRDADVSIFTQCTEHGIEQIPLRKVQLQANFRSAPTLVNWCNDLFHDMFSNATLSSIGEVPHAPGVAIQPDRTGAEVLCSFYDSEGEEVQAVVEHVAKLADTGESVGILCRARPHIEQLLLALRRKGIRWHATDIDPLNAEPIVLDLLNLHEVILASTSRLALFAVLRSPLFGLTLNELDKLAAADTEMPPIKRLNEALDWGRRRLYEAPLREVVEGVWLRLGGPDAYSAEALDRALFWFDLIDELGDAAYRPVALRAAVNRLYANPTEHSANVQIMTIHKSKGLEFDHVVVPFLAKRTQRDEPALLLWDPAAHGLLMGIKDDPVHHWLKYQNQHRDENEHKRLLYVAFTRARTSLFVSFQSKEDKDATGLAKWMRKSATPPTRSAGLIARGVGSRTAHPTNPVQADLFEINQLKRLPRNYVWQPTLRPTIELPTPLPANEPDPIADRFEVNLGTVIHKAFAWIASHKGVSMQDVEPRISFWARESALPPHEQQQLTDTATEHVRSAWQHRDGQWILATRKENYAELPMTGAIDDEIVHAVLDRMFVEDQTRWIIDYKTGTGTVEEEINRYRGQLMRYRQVAEGVFPTETIRIGLYLTSIPRFVEIE